MSNIGLIIEERTRDIGDFLVGRLLPFRKKRMVGPFVFIDHMGPSTVGPEKYMDVDQHPHIGLSTLTYLFEGEMMHQDSLGTHQLIQPGDVNWMTAGNGIVHTERTPQALRNGLEHRVHGYQIWVALPKSDEEIDPSFHHYKANELPHWKDENLNFILVAGSGFGQQSPVPVYSPLFMLDVSATDTQALHIKGQLEGEIGIVVVKGSITACNEQINAGQMLVSKTDDSCSITLNADSHVLLFGGQPFEEGRHIYWNFVSSREERIAQAKAEWKAKRFKMVAGDTTYVALPK